MVFDEFSIDENKIKGKGIDKIGGFEIEGNLDIETNEVTLTKKYESHTVVYSGSYFCESEYGMEMISGNWEIEDLSDAFKLWNPNERWQKWSGEISADTNGAIFADEDEILKLEFTLSPIIDNFIVGFGNMKGEKDNEDIHTIIDGNILDS